ncbi:helix-hairpin-helix domain-containing protein [Brevibacterium jeotgali]|nr:helix-hairpin-helix domain-containing protein [Brevibacterium jeotgali]
MSPSPAERFSSLLARSGERGWSPADDLGDGSGDVAGEPGDDAADLDDGTEEDGHAGPGARPGLSRTVLLCLLGAALTGVLVFVLAPSLLRGESPLAAQKHADTWEAAQADAEAAGDGGGSADGGERTTGGAAATPAAPVVVHVVGAVVTPGVVELSPGARVSDALAAVGGASGSADVDALNLARVLVDGEQIRVPEPGDETALGSGGGTEAGSAQSGPDPAGAGSGGTGDALVDLNSADLAALETLPGVGPVTAQSILDHRDAIGRFTTVDELLDVSGIGDATLSRIRDSVTVG